MNIGIDTNGQDNNGCTPLHIGLRMENRAVLALLWERAIDFTVANNKGESCTYVLVRSEWGRNLIEEQINDEILKELQEAAKSEAENLQTLSTKNL